MGYTKGWGFLCAGERKCESGWAVNLYRAVAARSAAVPARIGFVWEFPGWLRWPGRVSRARMPTVPGRLRFGWWWV